MNQNTSAALRIGIDLDGVGYDFLQCLSDYAVANGFPMARVERWTGWMSTESWGMTHEQYLDMCNRAAEDGHLFTSLEPLPGFIEMLHALRERGHECHVITARDFGADNAAGRNTRLWLERVQAPITSLTFSSDKTSVPMDAFIEDNLWNYDALEQAGCRSYLINRTWNQVEGGDDRRRVDSLDEFVQEMDRLAQSRAA